VNKLAALLRLRCPICLKAPIFSGAMAMHAQCPNCRYVFEREPGYFLGAIVIGYALAVPVVAGFGFGIHRLRPTLSWEFSFLLGFALYLGLTPTIFRYARGIWIYFDNWLDPPESR
jgi:uncharacterized protein (DUF983 family)